MLPWRHRLIHRIISMAFNDPTDVWNDVKCKKKVLKEVFCTEYSGCVLNVGTLRTDTTSRQYNYNPRQFEAILDIVNNASHYFVELLDNITITFYKLRQPNVTVSYSIFTRSLRFVDIQKSEMYPIIVSYFYIRPIKWK